MEDTLVFVDIFFFITAVAIVIVSAFLLVLIVYIIRIIRDVKKILGIIREQTENAAEDFASARQTIKKQGKKIAPIIGLIAATASKFNKKKKKSKKKVKNKKG